MALIETILIIVILVILVIVIYNVFFTKQTMLMSGIHPTVPGITIDNNRLPQNNSSNYSFALWFFIEDWNTNFGQVKNVAYFAPHKTRIEMKGSDLGGHGGPFDSTQPGEVNTRALNPSGNNFAAALDAFENDLLIGIKTFSQTTNRHSVNPPSILPATDYFTQQNVPNNPQQRYETFRVSNVNLQKWVCLICSVEGRNLDIYLQGKLVRSFILPGVAVSLGKDNVYIGGGGGNGPTNTTFNGHVARFQFFANSLNPQQAYNIYREGLGSSMIGDFFNKYRMKIQFFEYNNALGKPIVL